tara:strand:+ start:1457 stop:1768 length:312 start_codon:yes stop_codon:yes gene_type:complete
MQFLGDLFADEPPSWGLRGDPYLWRTMAAEFAQVEMPRDVADLYQQLKATFSKLTGKDFETCGAVKVKQFRHGGMSGGVVSGEFWRTKGFPLLIGRFAVSSGQ